MQLYTTPSTLRLICICRHLPCYIPAWVFLTCFPLPHTLFSPEPVRKLPMWVFSRFFALKNTPRGFLGPIFLFRTHFSLRNLPGSFLCGFFHAFLLLKTHRVGFFMPFSSSTHTAWVPPTGYSGIFASLSADRFSFTPFALSSVSINAIRTNFPFIT